MSERDRPAAMELGAGVTGEAADLVHGVEHRPLQLDGPVAPVAVGEGGEADREQRRTPPTVSAARSEADGRSFDHEDTHPRRRPNQRERGPQSRVPGADDGDVDLALGVIVVASGARRRTLPPTGSTAAFPASLPTLRRCARRDRCHREPPAPARRVAADVGERAPPSRAAAVPGSSRRPPRRLVPRPVRQPVRCGTSTAGGGRRTPPTNSARCRSAIRPRSTRRSRSR